MKKQDEPKFSKEEMELAIRKEVESRLNNPPKTLVDLVESEVQKRIRRQEWYYWTFLVLIVGFIAIYSVTLWHVQLAEIPVAVQKQLADESAISAKKEIMAILTYSQGASNSIANQSDSFGQVVYSARGQLNQNMGGFLQEYNNFTNRLVELNHQDNIVTDGNFQKLFVSQKMTNFDGKRIILDYEPIPHTIKLHDPRALFDKIDDNFIVEGNVITLTNEYFNDYTNDFKNGSAIIEYVRKSIH